MKFDLQLWGENQTFYREFTKYISLATKFIKVENTDSDNLFSCGGIYITKTVIDILHDSTRYKRSRVSDN